ncbi:hypothetical protein JCGZ_12203 [Jatropha curcas]|uniref:Aminotransferase-like plant mobile domain-containing protein n=1 Tax=Jatropha curcas TaxID=180498 RepID=A0A067LQ53_JATCU|nr:hypothetical protein JCGZ_12203 [Jatropha curcas]
MAQVPEIPASAYTPEMETLGVIPDIPVFKGNRIPVSRNALTSGMRPLQFLPARGSDFPIRYNTDAMRGFQSEDLLDPSMRSRVIFNGFGDYASGLRQTQPRFPPAMRYALMEWWNDCTHSFIFGFGEMTLTPANFTAITRLGFDGDAVPLDSRYQTTALGAELVATLLGVTTHTRYTSQGYVSYEVIYKFWVERIRARLAAWRELPADVRPAAPAYTREERDQAARSFIFYIISSQLPSQNKGDPAVLACLQDLSLVGTFDWVSLALAHLYHGLDVWTRGSVRIDPSREIASRAWHRRPSQRLVRVSAIPEPAPVSPVVRSSSSDSTSDSDWVEMADNTVNETGFSPAQIRTITEIIAAAFAQERAQNQIPLASSNQPTVEEREISEPTSDNQASAGNAVPIENDLAK